MWILNSKKTAEDDPVGERAAHTNWTDRAHSTTNASQHSICHRNAGNSAKAVQCFANTSAFSQTHTRLYPVDEVIGQLSRMQPSNTPIEESANAQGREFHRRQAG